VVGLRLGFEQGLASAADFKGKPGQLLIAPGPDGRTARVLMGVGDPAKVQAMAFRALPAKLPVGDYRIEDAPGHLDAAQVALAFALGGYGFDRYRKKREKHARLVVAPGVDVAEIREIAQACALAKDMVNTPANDMGPLQIETIAREIAEQHGASFNVITGDALLTEGYPSVHAVGRAADPARALELYSRTPEDIRNGESGMYWPLYRLAESFAKELIDSGKAENINKLLNLTEGKDREVLVHKVSSEFFHAGRQAEGDAFVERHLPQR
jgi:leucyl aminopeptidase